MESIIEVILAVSVIFSGVYSILLSNKNFGKKLGGLYKEDKNHHIQQAQLLITGFLCGGFGIWWVFNPGLLF